MLKTPSRGTAIEGAVAILSIVILLYLLTFFMLSTFFIHIGHLSKNETMPIGLGIAFLIYYFNLKYFEKQILKIKEKFDNESDRQKWIGRVIVLTISIGSLGSVIAIGILLK